MNKHFLLVCSESDNVINFRKELIIYLISKGCLVDVICSDTIRKKEILDLGINDFYSFEFTNRSRNPFQFLKLTKYIKSIINKTNPDYILSFQAKPNIATSRVIKKNNYKNFYPFIEGLGVVFNNKTLKQKILKTLVSSMYKKCFNKANKVVVLNRDDEEYLVNANLVSKEKVFRINGIGINFRNYHPVDKLPKEKSVLMVSRLVKEKGVFEFCEIAKWVKEQRKDINFILYGQEGDIKVKDIQQYIDDGTIIYGGYSRNIEEQINHSRLVILPSYYREGFPRSIMEAMVLKRTVIAYDNVGSKDAINNEDTGYLITKFDKEAFAQKILEIIDDDELLNKTGSRAREFCVSKLDSDIINSIIYKMIVG